MFKKIEWLRWVIVGTVLSTALALYFAPTEPSALQENSGSQEQQCTEYNSETTHNSDGTSRTVSVGKLKACDEQSAAKQDQNSSNEIRISEADLFAQEKMAYWTRFMGIFAAFGVVGLVWTLRETRNMMQADSRAYVELLDMVLAPQPTYGAQMTFVLRNRGRTPAESIRFEGILVLSTSKNESEKFKFTAGRDSIPAGTTRSISGRNDDCLSGFTFLSNIETSGTHAVYTGSVARESPDDFAPSISIEGKIAWQDIYGKETTIRVNDSSELRNSYGSIFWKNWQNRPGTEKEKSNN